MFAEPKKLCMPLRVKYQQKLPLQISQVNLQQVWISKKYQNQYRSENWEVYGQRTRLL